MDSHELGRLLLGHPNKSITASVDISTCDEDFDRRIFTNKLIQINDVDAKELVLLFDADPVDNYGKKL